MNTDVSQVKVNEIIEKLTFSCPISTVRILR